ncbi:MAG TPA: hypothetical protein VEC36_03890 [Patescibacteria group bacterium]|nr:hypothetical protein [Patescibacteria group bacterium]
MDGKTYCDLINESFDGNEKSIVQLSLVDVYDGATYEHGEVLIELIHNMSERKYTRLIEKLSLSDQKEIYYYLLAGLDFTNNSNFKRQKV